MSQRLNDIIAYLTTRRSLDFAGYNDDFLARKINQRISATQCSSPRDYCNYLQKNESELQGLLDELTINVSKFFRNPLLFELVLERLLPALVNGKSDDRKSLRVWSAGCAQGEEAYSLAIMINEALVSRQCPLKPHIFATDIDKKALEQAREGKYGFASIENVRVGLLKKYFDKKGEQYVLKSAIKDIVTFSLHNLQDTKTSVPPASIYGAFDIVFCRNVLIYYKRELQLAVLKKLTASLSTKGYLVLGEAETLPDQFAEEFIPFGNGCVFQKVRKAADNGADRRLK
jgi:chemotaxis protein methyltransferase CheR